MLSVSSGDGMERTLISWNIPNMITIPIMAILGWFLLGLIWQVAKKSVMGSGDTSTEGGY